MGMKMFCSGNISSNVCGNMSGNIFGNVSSNMSGNISNNMSGSSLNLRIFAANQVMIEPEA